jgi:3-dehydroquinate dehydratase II
MKIAIINGPNLNLLGKREPEIYGSTTFEMYLKQTREKYANQEISYYQSNVEGELVNYIQQVGFTVDAIILNPAAYTHTSVAIGDAIAAIKCPVVEVHISNTAARETFRHISHVSAHCAGTIIGLGLQGYQLAIEYLIQKQEKK